MPSQAITVGQSMVPCPYTIGHDQPLARAHAMMREHGIRHLPVLDGGRLVGVVSSRDLYFVEALPEDGAGSLTVDQAMTESPYVVAADTPLRDVATAMAEHHYGCALVRGDRGIEGIFTTVDGMRSLARLLAERESA